MDHDPPELSIRIDCAGWRFGPGKALLLSAIQDHGSISAASKALGMSYPRALKLIDEMDRQFPVPLVDKQHGGAARGGASLTRLGQDVLAAYRAVCATAREANTDQLRAFTNLMARE